MSYLIEYYCYLCIFNCLNFQQVVEETNKFKTQLRIEARIRFFEREISNLLSSDELKVIFNLIRYYYFANIFQLLLKSVFLPI